MQVNVSASKDGVRMDACKCIAQKLSLMLTAVGGGGCWLGEGCPLDDEECEDHQHTV